MNNKIYKVWANTKENGAFSVDYNVNSIPEAEAERAIEVVNDELGFQMSEEQNEQIKKFVLSNKKGHICLQPVDYDEECPKSGVCIWRNRKGKSVSIGWSSTGTPDGTDKWTNRWLEPKFIKEQIETVTYIACQQDLDRLDSTDIPETIEHGVFRYADGSTKVEQL